MDLKSFWAMEHSLVAAWSYSCIQSWIHIFLLFEGYRAPFFAHRWAIGCWISCAGLAMQRGTQMWEMSFCLFDTQALAPFFHFSEPMWLWCFTICLPYGMWRHMVWIHTDPYGSARSTTGNCQSCHHCGPCSGLLVRSNKWALNSFRAF